jgi:hypothetical protein
MSESAGEGLFDHTIESLQMVSGLWRLVGIVMTSSLSATGFNVAWMIVTALSTAISIGCPPSNVAQANLKIKTNFNILRSFSASNILTIYLRAFLQSLHPFEKNCFQGLMRDFHQNNPNTNKKFRWSFSAISRQLSFDVTEKEKVRGRQIW